MRILVVSHGMYPISQLGGVELSTSHISAILAEEHTVTVLLFSRDAAEQKEVALTQSGSPVKVVTIQHKSKSNNRVTYREILAKEEPDLIYVNSTYRLPHPFIHEANKRHIPIILNLRDFSLVCPRYTLLNNAGVACRGPKPRRCAKCLRPTSWGLSFIGKWIRCKKNMALIQ